MALTQLKTGAIADDAVTTDKLANAINTEITANTAKTTNATHTGDVTGATGLTIADNAVTLAKMAGGTDGQIITYDASGDPVAVGPGTDGQVLTSTGAGSPPAFEALATNTKITRVGEGSLNGVDSYTYTSIPSGVVQFSYQWYGASLVNNAAMLFRIGQGGGATTSGYYVAQAEIGDGTDSVTRSPRTSEIPIQTDSWEAAPGVSQGRIDFVQAEGNLWTWKMQNYYYATSSGHYVNMLNTGYVSLGGALERAVLFSGSGNFDAGNVYLTYTQIV